VTDGNAGNGADPASCSVRLLAGSIESPELASSLALGLPACWLHAWRVASSPPPSAVLRLAADVADFFVCDVTATLISLRCAGEINKVETALIRANSSYLIMTLRQEHSEISSCRSSGVVLLYTMYRNQPNQ